MFCIIIYVAPYPYIVLGGPTAWARSIVVCFKGRSSCLERALVSLDPKSETKSET